MLDCYGNSSLKFIPKNNNYARQNAVYAQTERAMVNNVRHSILDFLELKRESYSVVFLHSATEAFRLVTETFDKSNVFIHSSCHKSASKFGCEYETVNTNLGIYATVSSFDGSYLEVKESFMPLYRCLDITAEVGYTTNYKKYKDVDYYVFDAQKFGCPQVGVLVYKTDWATSGEKYFYSDTNFNVADIITIEEALKMFTPEFLKQRKENLIKIKEIFSGEYDDSVSPRFYTTKLPVKIARSFVQFAAFRAELYLSLGSNCQKESEFESQVMKEYGVSFKDALQFVRLTFDDDVSIAGWRDIKTCLDSTLEIYKDIYE